MEKRNNITINPVTVGVGAIVIAFAILLVFSVSQLFGNDGYGQGLKIDNLSEHFEDLPTDQRKSMESILYNIVEMNIPSDQKTPKKGALIRDGSVVSNYDESTDINHGNFIVDIESVKQSYLMQYEWSSQEDNPNLSSYQMVASCLSEKYLIYDAFDCRDLMSPSGGLGAYSVLMAYLPYYGLTEYGDNIYAQIRRNSNNENYLEVNVDSCGDAKKIDSAKQVLSEWLDSLKIDESSLSFQYRDLCEGGAHS